MTYLEDSIGGFIKALQTNLSGKRKKYVVFNFPMMWSCLRGR